MIKSLSELVGKGAVHKEVKSYMVNGEPWEMKVYKGENANKVNENIKKIQKSSQILKILGY